VQNGELMDFCYAWLRQLVGKGMANWPCSFISSSAKEYKSWLGAVYGGATPSVLGRGGDTMLLRRKFVATLFASAVALSPAFGQTAQAPVPRHTTHHRHHNDMHPNHRLRHHHRGPVHHHHHTTHHHGEQH
jgi:hypothetical protein